MPKLFAIWDHAKKPLTLGKGMIFLEEINALCLRNHLDGAAIAWCSAESVPELFSFSSLITDVMRLESVKEARCFFEANAALYSHSWGLKKVHSACSWDDSFLFLSEICGRHFPKLEPSPRWIQAAQRYLSRWPEKKIIALHLKQHRENLQSNAQLSAWNFFLERVNGSSKEYFFVLVGNEPPEPLLSLSNVVWTKGESLLLDLALVAQADAFMGMSSGLCQMAMFHDKPHVIFKHPGHHTEMMRREFQGNERFPFTNDRQKFVIAFDTAEVLWAEWNRLRQFL